MDAEEERIRDRIAEREKALKAKANLLKLRVERIRQMTDIKAMVGERPAVMVGASVVTGFLLKKLLSRRHEGNRPHRLSRGDLEDDAHYAKARLRSSRKLKDEFLAVVSVVAGRIAMNVLSDLAKRIIPRKLDVSRAEKDFRHDH